MSNPCVSLTRAYERVNFEYMSLNVVVEFSWTSFKVKVGLICRVFKHGR